MPRGRRQRGSSVPDAYREVDQLLADLVDRGRVPGLAIQVSSKGETLFAAGYGNADLETGTEVHPESTVFRIASISKPITATALARAASTTGEDA